MSDAAGEAWDSNVLSRTAPGSAAARFIEARAQAGATIAVAAPAWAEIVAGFENGVRRGRLGESTRVTHGWLRAAVSRGDVDVLAFDELAARATGVVRGAVSLGRPKSWDVDVAIAAVCWSNGYTLITRNRVDFDEIGAVFERAIGGPPLRIAAPP